MAETITITAHQIKNAQEAKKPIITLKYGESYNLQILNILGGFFRVHFSLQSSVLLPEYALGHKDSAHANDSIPHLHAIAMIWFHCAFTNHKYYITGHADRSGSENYNLEISKARAQNLYSLIGFDRELFKTTADAPFISDNVKKHEVLINEQLTICNWASSQFGWKCGHAENSFDYLKSFKQFQSSYNDSFIRVIFKQNALTVDGDWGPLTWGAVFDCYMIAIAGILQTDSRNIGTIPEYISLQKRKMAGDGYQGCGERYPVTENKTDGVRSFTNRRADLFFIEDSYKCSLSCDPQCISKGCVLYDTLPGRLPDTKEEKYTLHIVCFNTDFSKMSACKCLLSSTEGNVESTTDSNGEVRFTLNKSSLSSFTFSWSSSEKKGAYDYTNNYAYTTETLPFFFFYSRILTLIAHPTFDSSLWYNDQNNALPIIFVGYTVSPKELHASKFGNRYWAYIYRMGSTSNIEITIRCTFNFAGGWSNVPTDQQAIEMAKFQQEFITTVENIWSMKYWIVHKDYPIERYLAKVRVIKSDKLPVVEVNVFRERTSPEERNRYGYENGVHYLNLIASEANRLKTREAMYTEEPTTNSPGDPAYKKVKGSTSFEQYASAHEVGHLFDLEHIMHDIIKCSASTSDNSCPDKCYGMSYNQKNDIMGIGNNISPRDCKPFIRVMKQYYMDEYKKESEWKAVPYNMYA